MLDRSGRGDVADEQAHLEEQGGNMAIHDMNMNMNINMNMNMNMNMIVTTTLAAAVKEETEKRLRRAWARRTRLHANSQPLPSCRCCR